MCPPLNDTQEQSLPQPAARSASLPVDAVAMSVLDAGTPLAPAESAFRYANEAIIITNADNAVVRARAIYEILGDQEGRESAEQAWNELQTYGNQYDETRLQMAFDIGYADQGGSRLREAQVLLLPRPPIGHRVNRFAQVGEQLLIQKLLLMIL